ncbi:MAG TPA: tautomerase family protein [Bacillota bacterium]
MVPDLIIVRAHMIRGRSRAQKEAFVAGVTRDVCRVLDVPPQQVRVTLVEIEPDGWGIAGLTAPVARGGRHPGTSAPPGDGTGPQGGCG